MTAPECPVCATPHEADATICTFCGVSLLDPPTEAGTKAETATRAEAESGAEPVAETETESEAATDDATGAMIDDAAEGVAEAAADAAAVAEPGPEREPESGSESLTAATAEAETAGTGEPPANSVPPAPSAPRKRIPSFARPANAATMAQRRIQRIEWGLVGGLAVLLLVQVLVSDFDQLAANATARPWLQRACSFLRCSLPPWREPRALRILQRDVIADPAHPGLLRISASFRNDARWAQPWPRLRVSLADADGRAIATRAFAANEYLDKTQTANGIASGQVASIAFDVVDPSSNVTAFTFKFE